MTPATCGVTVTLAPDVTVPSASMITGMSARRAVATPTVLGGAPRPVDAPAGPPGPRAPATAGWPAGPVDGAARCVRYHARPAVATSAATAIALPSHRRRCATGGAAGAAG